MDFLNQLSETSDKDINQYVSAKDPLGIAGMITDEVEVEGGEPAEVENPALASFFTNTFGAGSTSEMRVSSTPDVISPFWSPVTVKTGETISIVERERGDSSKPISVYSKGITNAPLTSSVGLKINIERHALTINVGTDDISIKASYTDDLGDSISGGVYISLKDAEVGGITSKTKRIDKDGKTMYETSYEKSSIGLTTIAAAIIIYYSGGLLTPTAKPLPIPKPILKPVIT